EAYSVLESIRTGAALVLEMERDDLQILIIGHSGQEEVDAYLYDPMPGGSGLLDQIINQFDVVHDAAYQVVSDCPSICERGCIDCLWTYRNAFFHKHLDRKLAKDFLENQGNEIEFAFDIPPKLSSGKEKEPSKAVNDCEEKLRGMLHRLGFPDPRWHHQIQLGKGIGSTSPDCFYLGDDELDPGTCIYLDGLSEHIHGNPRTQRQDQIIRETLRSKGYEVIEIAASDLDDKGAMTRHFYKLGRILIGKDHAQKVKENQEWFGDE
ncbi:DUF1998 domain-containing protein, partial [bacterium]|nr:DUF1998 domain-containing protein [bacterium]MBU1025513.1 DUF1998 domain-containing protein [bacterium]